MSKSFPEDCRVILLPFLSDPEIFTAFVHDVLGIRIQIDKVQTEKAFKPPIGYVASRFDLFAEDLKNRIIVDIQHVRYLDHYDAFLHYHCAAILEQVTKAENYRPKLAVYSIIVLTGGDKHNVDWATIEFDPKTRAGEGLGEIPHKVVYLCPKYGSDQMPAALHEWLHAIDDTLDETVEEGAYENPLIQRIFDLIEQDSISPEERARMFEEYNQEALKQNTIKQAKIDIAQAMVAKAMDIALVAELTSLSEAEVAALQESSKA